MERTDDAELLALIREGDRGAMEAFALQHGGWAIVYARNHGAGDLAEDVAQIVVTRMITRPPADLRNTSARPYMGTAIKHEITRVHGRPLMVITGESGLADMPDNATSPTAAIARDERLRPALELVAELPTPQREVLMLRETEGLTFAEIATLTGRSASIERAAHRRVLAGLRRKLSRYLPSSNDR